MKRLIVIALLVNASLLAIRVLQDFVADAQAQSLAKLNGDVNGDQSRDISDPVFMLNWLFANGPEPVAFADEVGGGGLTPEQEEILAHAAEVLQYFKVVRSDVSCDEIAEEGTDVAVPGDTVVIEGANLQIVNGLGATNGDPENAGDFEAQGNHNCVGNLIVGYNELRTSGAFGNQRTGSHNIIVGMRHNYTSHGGLIVGMQSSILGPFSSVTGGQGNRAEGASSSVSGGVGNQAAGDFTSVTGGSNNFSFGNYASISGGSDNMATGDESSVTGGAHNVAAGSQSAISGGVHNTTGGEKAREDSIAGHAASVSGGERNEALGPYSSVSGGRYNIASGKYSSVNGGGSDEKSAGNHATGDFSSISGGLAQRAKGEHSWVGGGFGNAAEGPQSSATGGLGNHAVGQLSSVSGGASNQAYATYSSIAGGLGNLTEADYSTVAGGEGVSAAGSYVTTTGVLEDPAVVQPAFLTGFVARRRKWWRGKEGERLDQRAESSRRRCFLHIEDRGAKPDAVHGATCGVVAETCEKCGLTAMQRILTRERGTTMRALLILTVLIATGAIESQLSATPLVRVSVKFVLDEDGDRPTGVYETLEDVQNAINQANVALMNNGVCWLLQLVDVVDVAEIDDYFVISSDEEMVQLETDAINDPVKYKWNSNAINIYLIRDLHGAAGRCSFPGHSPEEVIVINTDQPIKNHGVGWLHEIGHYLSLTHTFDCALDGCVENEATCRGMGARYFDGTRLQWSRCADVCPQTNNIMSYNEFKLVKAEFSPCQVEHLNFHLFDKQGTRSHVVQEGIVRVTSQYSTIVRGIAAACPGEVVLIDPGTYPEAPLTIKKHVILKAVKGRVIIKN